ncbi:CMGC SRPK kinase [Lecanosticta acicola]|uniref:non-specific serine/threonine protein kinase n=1 Tax=Lecanosticta acicola TaxID=111012 RepID=A0AAI8Z0D3_9PEZI|nr:CMGC SRPK kinase [Lecanosticta acicola]
MSLFRWLSRSVKRTSTTFSPLRFPTSGFKVYGDDVFFEEEGLEEFRQGLFYPMQLGDTLASRYQVVGKLGFGSTSTVWLARDMQAQRHVVLKVYTRGQAHEEEFELYRTIRQTNPSHPGYPYVASALDTFMIQREGGYAHRCLVQRPMWDSFSALLNRNPSHRFTEELLKAGLQQIFLALDYLHSECKIVHTDIKGDNILQEIEDESILTEFVEKELEHPCPRKFVDGETIYARRSFSQPKRYGRAVLSDFGAAVRGDEKRNHDAQPNIYRSPEVMIKTDWKYPIDIWNVGAMVWDLFEGQHLFHGQDPDGEGYSTRAHLAELIGTLGPPPKEFLRRGKRSHEFFDEQGNFIADVPVAQRSLEEAETRLEGSNKSQFLDFVRGMLQWRPEDRKTAKELLNDSWLNS